MEIIVAESGKGKFTETITIGSHLLIADEPLDSGGNNLGPSPYDLDAETFRPKSHYERFAPVNRVMPSSGDYKTVGALYQSIREALIRLSNEIGEQQFFCGDPHRQITPVDSALPGLIAIHDLESALRAVDTIIIQGEGATQITDSHFERFSLIKKEYLELLKSIHNSSLVDTLFGIQ